MISPSIQTIFLPRTDFLFHHSHNTHDDDILWIAKPLINPPDPSFILTGSTLEHVMFHLILEQRLDLFKPWIRHGAYLVGRLFYLII
jgi:hypothetical protein